MAHLHEDGIDAGVCLSRYRDDHVGMDRSHLPHRESPATTIEYYERDLAIFRRTARLIFVTTACCGRRRTKRATWWSTSWTRGPISWTRRPRPGDRQQSSTTLRSLRCAAAPSPLRTRSASKVRRPPDHPAGVITLARYSDGALQAPGDVAFPVAVALKEQPVAPDFASAVNTTDNELAAVDRAGVGRGRHVSPHRHSWRRPATPWWKSARGTREKGLLLTSPLSTRAVA